MNSAISVNLQNILNRISKAEIKANRKPGSVKLVAVSKFHSKEEVIEAVNSNQFLFGENRVQEANKKFPEILQLNPKVELHIIGTLQTNKVKKAVQIANCIESVDRIDLLAEIEKQCAIIDKNIDVLFEVHTGEESKSGFTSINEIRKCLNQFLENKYPHIKPKGFMTMAPFTDDTELIRKSFRTLKSIQNTLQAEYNTFDFSELSMGMSNDFEIAIEEGSTLVRVGTAIFGERDYSKNEK